MKINSTFKTEISPFAKDDDSTCSLTDMTTAELEGKNQAALALMNMNPKAKPAKRQQEEALLLDAGWEKCIKANLTNKNTVRKITSWCSPDMNIKFRSFKQAKKFHLLAESCNDDEKEAFKECKKKALLNDLIKETSDDGMASWS